MKRIYFALFLSCLSVVAFAQVTNSESFNTTPFVPTGWTNLLTSGTATWNRVTASVHPTGAGTHSGAGMAQFNSWTASTGVRSIITPSYTLVGRGAATPTVSFWMYRDNGFNTTADKIDVYINTSATWSGGTLLGTVNRARGLSPTVGSNGWYQYTFNVPGGYSGATNYLILRATSAYGNDIYVDDVSWQSYPSGSPCSGTPAPGNTLASSTSVCSGGTTTLSLQNPTTGTGVTYQWKSASDVSGSPGSYSNISGATNDTYVATITAATWYKCDVTCSAATGTSTQVQITLGGYGLCGSYCAAPASDCTDNDVITNVTFSGINNTTACANGTLYTSPMATVSPGTSPTLSVTKATVYTEYIAAWIDFNQNGTFESAEFLDLGAGVGTVSAPFPIPLTATLGVTRMRVRDQYNTALTSGQACSSYTYGETEDYLVNIVCTNPITTNPSASTATCVGYSPVLSVTASGTNTYLWYDNGATNSNSGGTSTGVTTATFTPTTSGTGTKYYYCVVTAGCGTAFPTSTAGVTVNPSPNAITGTLSACAGSTSALSSTTGGGAWTTSSGIASVSSGGVVTAGGTAGTTTVSYTVAGCAATATFAVLANPGTTTGTHTVCSGLTTTLSNPGGIGTWTSFNTSVATVGSATGIVTGVAGGTAVISYANGCGTPVGSVVTVNQTPGAITGSTISCVGQSNTLANPNAGGTWSSSSTAVGTIDASSGAVTGISNGTTTISYDLGNGCAVATRTQDVNNPPTSIAVTPGTSSTICLTASGAFTATATATANVLVQNFNSGIGSWTVDNTGTAIATPSVVQWNIQADGYTPGGSITGTFHTSDNSSFAMTNADAGGSGSTTVSKLISPVFSLTGYTAASLTFEQWYLNWTSGDAAVSVEISTNGGSSWSTLSSYLGSPQGAVSAFAAMTISLNAYAGSSNLRLRYNYNSVWGYGWAVDNIRVQAAATPTYAWAGISGATGLSCTSCASPTITPTALGANAYSVSATASGCAISNTVTVTTEQAGAVTVTGGGTACGSATLNASGGTGGTIYYQGTTSGGTSTGTPSSSQSVSSTGTYYFRARTATAACWGTQGSAAVTINAVPAASPTNSGVICNGGTVTLTANPSGGATVYNWSGPNLSSSTAANPTATPTTTTTYSLTVSDGSGNPGCSPSTIFTTIVTVNPTPAAAPSSTGPICNGGVATLVANPSGGASTYNWSGPNLSSATVASPNCTPTVTTVYSLTVTDGSGLSGCSPSTVYTVTQTVRPTPSAAPSNDGHICIGGTVTLAANPLNSASVFTWSGSSLASTTAQDPTATPGSTSIYSLTVTDGSGEPGCSPSTVYTTSVTVNAVPTAAPTNNSPICNGGTVTLTGNGANGASTYAWTGLSLVSATGSPTTATPNTTTIYSLTVTDGSGHSGCSPSTIYTTSVTVNTTPTAAPTNSGPICNGGTVTLTANPAGGASVYSWSGPDLSSATDANPTATPTVTSVYSLTVSDGTANPGCSPATIYTTQVTVRPTPSAAPTNDGYICNGGTVTLAANPANGASVFTWSGSSLVTTTGAAPTATPIATSVYSLTVTDGTGDNGCSPSTVYTTSVTVNPKPIAAPTNNSPICNGGTVTLAANGSAGASTYNWTGSGLVASTGAVTTATPTATSVYSVTVTDGSGNPGCSPSTIYTTSVTVNSTPIAAPSNDGYICNGGTVNLAANPSGGASVYSWSGPDLSSTTVANPTATPTVTSVYSLTVTDGSGFSGCSPSTVYTTSVTVNNAPTAAPSNNGYICNGGTVTLTANGANGAATYAWSGSSLVASTGGVTTAAPTATNVYSLTVTDGSGRSGCSPATIYTTSVTVNATPIAAPGNSSPICNGGIVFLTANPSGGVSTYNWSGPNLSSATVANPGATPTVTTVYSLTVTDGSAQPGCSPSTIYTTSVTVNLTPTAAPTNNGYICNGGTVTLAANPAGGATVYSWSGSSLLSTTAQNPTATPTATSVYSLTVSDGSGNSGCSPATVYTTSVTVNSTPIAAPTNSGIICNGGTVTLNANPAGGASTYAWSGPSLASATLQNPTATPTVTSVYSLTVTDGSGQPGCSPATVYTTSVTVNPAPTLTSATNNGPICQPATLSLSANGAANVTGYSWAGPVALTGGTTATPTVPGSTTAATGIYTVTVNNATGSGCAATYTTSATVNTIPTVASITPSSTNLCAGATLGLSAGSVSGSGSLTSYNWSGPNTYNTTTSSSSTNLTVSTASSGVYTLSVTYAGLGCTSNPVTSTAVTVNSLPTMASIGVSPGNLCAGAVLSLTGNGASGTGTLLSYNWSGPGSYSSTTAGSTQLYTTPDAGASGVYSVTVTYTGTGCTSNPVTSSSVTVNALPQVYNVTGGGFYCSGGSGVNIGLDGSESGINYQLYLGSTAVGTPVAGTGSAIDFGLITAAGTYSVSATNTTTLCNNNMAGTTTVTVGSVPVVYSVTGGGGYCAGGTGVSVGLSNSQGSVSYQLRRDGVDVGGLVTGTGSSFSFGSFTTAGNYTVMANPSATCAVAMSGSATVYINPLPNVYNVSGGGQYCAGGAGFHIVQDFSVVGINYQLYNGASAVGSPVAGASSGLDFGVQTAAGTYSVLATNATTSCVATMSGTPTIVVNPLPTVFTVTGGGQYCAGSTGVGIGLSGSTSGINYQVYNGATAVGSPVAGTGAALSLGTFTAAGTYTVVATNATTLCVNNMSGSATVIMNALPVAYTVTGGGNFCFGGSGVHVGLSNSEIGVNYQLYSGATAIGSPVAGASSGLDFGFITSAGTYTVFATNTTTSCTSSMTGSATVVVNPLPTVFTATGSATICGGYGTPVGLTGSESGVNYQLYNGSSTVGSAMAGTGAAINFGSMTAAGTYTVRATNATTSCVNNMAGSPTIVVNPAPTAYTVTGGGAYCSGGSGNAIGLSNTQSGVNYQLFNGASTVGSAMAGTGSAISFGTFTTTGTYTVMATNGSTTCTNAMTGSAVISIDPLPTVYTVTGGGSYCNGGSGVNVGLNNSATGINYQLFLGATSVGSAMAGTGSSLDFGLQTTAGTYTVQATNATTFCTSNMTGTAVVSVNAVPAVQTVTGGGNYCSGSGGLPVGLAGSASGINYQLYRGATSVGSVVAGTGSAITFGLQTTAGTYTVMAIDAGNSCTTNMSGSAVIGIYSVPSAFTVTGGGNFCVGAGGVAVGLISSTTGVNYQLYNGASTVGSVVSGTGSALNFGTQTVAGTYTVLATDATNFCTTPMSGSAAVVVNPLPTAFNVTGGGNYCAGGTGVLVGMAFTNSGVDYQLYRGSTAVGSPVAGTSSSLSFGMQTVAGTYTVSATNASTSCTNGMTGSAVVVMNPLPLATYTVTGGGQYCSGGSGVAVGLSGSESSSISYQLYNGSTATGSAVAGTGAAISFGSQTASGTYTVFATNTSTTCTNNMPGSVAVTINALPAVYTVTGGGTLCSGNTGYHVGLSNSEAGVNYQLYNGSTTVGSPMAGTGAALDFGVYTVAGTYSINATNATTTCQNNMSGTATIVVNPLPTVQTMTGGGSYCNGGSGVTIGLAGSQTGVNYQLYMGSSVVGSAVSGTGSAISFGLLSVAGTYTVRATNNTTSCVNNMGGTASIVVNPLPTVYSLTGGGSYCAGGAGVTVGLSGSQAGINYQLYLGSSTYGSYISGTGSALDFGYLDVAGNYTVYATNPGTGCTSNMSASATVAINPLPTAYNVSGGGSYCSGTGGLTVTLSGSQVGINYQLYSGGTSYGSASGTGSAISFASITPGGTYTVLASNPVTSCTRAMTGSSSITVLPLPVVNTVTGGGVYCAGGIGVNIGLSSSQVAVNYQLFNGSTPVGAPFAGTGMTFSFGLQSSVGTYTVFATNVLTGCTAPMSGSATIATNPLPSVQTVTGGGAYCSGGTGVAVGLTGSETGVNYQLYYGTAPAGSPVAGSGSAINFGSQMLAGNYTVNATNTSTGCTNSMSGIATVVVNPLPATYPVTGGGSYCNGGTGVGITVGGSNTGVNYQLYNGSTPVGSPMPGTGSSITFSSVTAAGTYTVRATNGATGCSSNMTGSTLVIVNPLPTAYNVTGGGPYCVGGTGVNIDLNGSNSGITYSLYRGGTLVSNSSGTGGAISFGNQLVAATYTVLATNSATGCVRNMNGSATVVINPLPNAQIVSGGGNYCAGGIGVNVTLLGSDVGTNYQLFRNGVASGSVVAGSGATFTFGLQTTAGTYSVSAVNVATGCANNMLGTVAVNVDPLPLAYSVTGGGNTCTGTVGVELGLSGSQSGVNYRLYNGASVSGPLVAGTGGAISFGMRTVAGTYTVVATNPATGCVSGMTGSAAVIVNPAPAAYAVSGGGTYCAGGSGFNIMLGGSNSGISYQLYNGAATAGSPVLGTGSAISFGINYNAGTYTVLATNTATSCTSNMAGSAMISVNPQPTVYSMNGGGAYCSGGVGLPVGLAASDMGVNYQLYYGGTASGASVPGTGSAINFGLKTGAGSYSVVATNPLTGCTGSMSGTSMITVNPLPVVQTVMGGGGYCAGGVGVFVTLGGSQTGVNYQLYNGSAVAGSAMPGTGGALSFGSQTMAGTYSVLATQVATTCSRAMTSAATVSVYPLPVAHNVTGGGNYCAGGSGVTIGLSGSAVGISYQLYNGSSPAGSSFVGTGSAISFGMKTAPGTYSVLATDGVTGCTMAMSGTTAVGVNAVPAIHDVTGGGNYCAGSTGMHVGLSGSNAGINYQLYNGSSPAGAAIAGTGDELDFGTFLTAGTYSVRATNPATSCSSNMSDNVEVAINPLPVAFVVTGGGNYCTGGVGVAVGLTGSEFGVNYQLFAGSMPVGSAVAGTGGAISFSTVTNAGTYIVVATNTMTSCTRNMTGNASVVVNALPVAYDLSGGGNFCTGAASAPIILSGSNTGITYRLYNGATAVGSPMTGTGSALNFGVATTSGNYSVLATNTATSCVSGMNGIISVIANALPAVYTVTGGGSFCTGGAGVAVGVANSQAGVVYQLYLGAAPVGTQVAGTGGAISFGMQSIPGSYTVVAEHGTTHCTSNMSGAATITENALPAVYNMTGGGGYCAGGTGISIGINGSQTGASYRLYNGTATVGGPLAGTGAALDFGIKTAGGNYSVIATDLLHGCTRTMTGVSTIVVNPLPAGHSVTGGGSFCAGSTGVNIGVDGSDNGITYTMNNGSAAVGSTVAGTGLPIDFGAQADGGIYTVLAVDATTGCSTSMTGNATVVVNPMPVAHNVVASAASYCAGGTGINIMLAGSGTATSYQLYNGATPSGVAIAGNGSPISFGFRTAAGVYTVTATTSAGCSSSMPGSAPVSINPQPAVFSVSGGGAVCAGTAGAAINLNGSETGVTYKLFNGSVFTGTTVAGTGSPVSFAPQNTAGTYIVTAVNSSTGCTRNMSGGTTISINSAPSVYTVTGGGSYCDGGTGTHVGLSGSSASARYQLYKDGTAIGLPVTGTGAALDLGSFMGAGAYSITATNPVTTCMSNMTGSVNISVNSLPEIASITGGGGYCPGAAGVALGVSGSTTGITYRLYRGSSMVATATGTGSLSFGTYTVAGVYTVSAVNASTGCMRNMSGAAVVSVNPVPSAHVVTGGGTYCEGGTGVSIGLGTSESAVQYTLFAGATSVGSPVTGTGSAISFGLQATSGTYSVLATNAASCTNAMTGSVAVAITPTVVPTVSMSLSTTNTVCAGTSVMYTAAPANGGTTPTYQWFVNASPVGSGSSSYSYTPANGDVVEVTMTSNAACPVPATANASEAMTVNPTHTPVVTIEPDHAGALCKGASVTFTATPGYGGTAPIYSWMRNGSLAGAGATYTVAPDDSDVIYCMMTSNFECRSVNTVVSGKDTMDVVEPQLPTVIITADGGVSINPGQFSTFTAIVSNAGPSPEFQWIINGEEIAGATSLSFVTNLLQNLDTVTVRILSSGPCGGTYSFSSMVINVNVSVANVPVKEMDVRVMPNPNNGEFSIKGSLGFDMSEMVDINITNMLGQVVYTNKVKAIHGAINERVTLDNTLSNGMYLVNLHAGDRSKVIHVTVSR